jgi:hypothetical protein
MLNQDLLNQLVQKNKDKLEVVKSIAINEAWKILQLTIADIIQIIQINSPELAGSDKKIIALDTISKFYDKVFIIVDLPFVPKPIQPIIQKYIKSLLMLLVGSSIDAMVSTFKNLGLFIDSKYSKNINVTTDLI